MFDSKRECIGSMDCSVPIGRDRERLIVGKSTCPWTQRALALKWHTKSVMIDKCRRGSALRDKLIAETHHTTVPIVFDQDKFIGGYTELVQYVKHQ